MFARGRDNFMSCDNMSNEILTQTHTSKTMRQERFLITGTDLDSFNGIFHLEQPSLRRECVDTSIIGITGGKRKKGE